MQTQQENPNVWIDENLDPHYLHDGWWYGPNVVESLDGTQYKTNGRVIKTENGQNLYEYDGIWYGQEKTFKFNNGNWEEKTRDPANPYYTVSYNDIGTINTLIDIHLIDILVEYHNRIKELSEKYNQLILSVKLMIRVYDDITLEELRKHNQPEFIKVIAFLKYYSGYSGNELRKRYRNTLLSSLIKIITDAIDSDPEIIEYKIHFKSVVEPKLQDMLYTRIIWFFFRYDNQDDINVEIEKYIEIFDRQASRDLIGSEYEKIRPYLEYALLHANELNDDIQINESELPKTGSDTFLFFDEEGELNLKTCLDTIGCYIYIISNTGIFSKDLIAKNLTAMVHSEDILIKGLLSFRSWLFRCTGPPQQNPDGTTVTDGVVNDFRLSDNQGNKLIDPVAYVSLPVFANSNCLISLSNILSVLYYRNRIMYVIMKDTINRSVSWDILYNYNIGMTMVSAKHCQEGSKQVVYELRISRGEISKEAEDTGKVFAQMEDQTQNQLLTDLEIYQENNRQRYLLARENYEQRELQIKEDTLNQMEEKALEIIMREYREESRRVREQQLVQQNIGSNRITINQGNSTYDIERVENSGPSRPRRARNPNVQHRPY